MKILLYFEGEELISKSGVGRAYDHQKTALEAAGVAYTTDPRCKDYDILHINTYGINSVTMVHNARRMNKKVIYHAHSTEEDFRNSFTLSNVISPFIKQWLIGLYKQADMLITPTSYSRGILERYGLNQPIRVISNGIDLDRFRRSEAKAKAFREYFHFSEDDKVVLGVGLLFHRKGLPDFVKVAKMMPDYKFVWFGDISRFIIPVEISELVENPPANVIFPGYIAGEIIEGAYSAASCFFFPSYEETEGIVVLEALASGCPVLVRDIGAFRPWLVDGYNCHKAVSNDGFVQKIRMITEGRAADTTANGMVTAEERSITRIGEQLRDAYETVLRG
ncbi:MAG: glycosyltransferase family 4 protein [Solobacterium sp.]|nr:glycosyltransferase family 4 protein [Solobacterium sp.]